MSKSIEIMQLEASLDTIYVAHCEKCGKEKDEDQNGANHFAQKLHKEGWKVVDVFDGPALLCPQCIENQTK